MHILTQHEILSLPMFPHITEEQVDYVCGQIREYVATGLKKARATAP